MQGHSTDQYTRAPLGRHDPQLPSPPPIVRHAPVPQTVLPPANNTATYARICALFREQYPDTSNNFSDRELRYELNLRPLAMDAVRRFHEPYHFSTNDDMDLMNLPYGLGDTEHFIVGVLLIIVHDTVPDAVAHVGPNYNTVTFYSPRLGPSGCAWRYTLPLRENDPVRIKRVPC